MKIFHPFLALFAAAFLMGAAGCKQNADTEPTADEPSAEQTSEGDHGHEHAEGEGHGHEHAEGEEHAHAHSPGPHDGTLADWGGGKYHVEFMVSHDKQQATVYILEGDEQTPAPIAAEQIELTIQDPQMQVTLEADPLESDPEGQASRFVGTHEKLGVVQEYAGTITGVVDGTPYTAEFEEVAHGDHEHE